MSARPLPKGWCPGAYRPMMSGDGLIVRVRPMLARLDPDQLLGLCDAASRFGSGLIDLTSRANLQLRGVREENHEPLVQALGRLGLLDADPATEARRNILVAPEWRSGDDTERLVLDLTARLAELPDLPAKFGFAVDAGPAPVLGAASADIRIERGASGGLILRADGRPQGAPVTREAAVQAAIDLAHWFRDSGGASAGRMARHWPAEPFPAHLAPTDLPANPAPLPAPGPGPQGPAYGLAFGRIEAGDLAGLYYKSCAHAMRVTPARTIIFEGGRFHATRDVIIRPNDPLLRVDACPGAPFCASATVETRALARRLAPHVTGTLHVSGCVKGCARASAADITLVGNNSRFDLVEAGTAWDVPAETGLDPDAILADFGAT